MIESKTFAFLDGGLAVLPTSKLSGPREGGIGEVELADDATRKSFRRIHEVAEVDLWIHVNPLSDRIMSNALFLDRIVEEIVVQSVVGLLLFEGF